MEETFSKVVCQLVGTDGNVFALMGRASKALKDAGYDPSEMIDRVTESESYNKALVVLMEYVKEPGEDD